MKSVLAVILGITLWASVVSAFAPAPRPIFTPGRLIPGQTSVKSFVLQAEEKQPDTAVEPAAPQVDTDGTYFDDEVRHICQ